MLKKAITMSLEEETAHMTEEQKGCAILDSGATTMVSSLHAAETIQQEMISNKETGAIKVSPSEKVFKFADGDHDAAANQAEIQVSHGLLKGKSLNMHLLDKKGNETAPLYSVNDMRDHRMVVDCEENKCMFKDDPTVWYKLPVTKKGLLMIPLTKEACARHQIETEQINYSSSRYTKK